MSAMFEEIRRELEELASGCDDQHVGADERIDQRMVGQAEGLRLAITVVQRVITAHTARCTAVLWHGPGHQSKTTCQQRGPHTVHSAIYGSQRQVAEWYDDEAMTGFFDEPPKFGEAA